MELLKQLHILNNNCIDGIKKTGKSSNSTGRTGNVAKATNHTPPITKSYQTGIVAPMPRSSPMTLTSNWQTDLVF